MEMVNSTRNIAMAFTCELSKANSCFTVPRLPSKSVFAIVIEINILLTGIDRIQETY